MRIFKFLRGINVMDGDEVGAVKGTIGVSASLRKDAIVTKIVPKDAERGDAFDVSKLRAFLILLWEVFTDWIERGFIPLPFKVHLNGKMVMLGVHRKLSALGRFIANLPAGMKVKMMLNWASLADYMNQPFDTMAMHVHAGIVHVPDRKVKLDDLRSFVTSRGIDWVAFVRQNKLKEGLVVPFADGTLFLNPKSQLWRDLPPETVKKLSHDKIGTMKLIGHVAGNRFVCVKGVAPRYSWREWVVICGWFKVDPKTTTVLISQHCLKNKLGFHGFEPGTDISVNLGFHCDDRSFRGRKQIMGLQNALRSANLLDRNRWWTAVKEFAKSFFSAVNEGRVLDLVRLCGGDPKLTEDGAEYRQSILHLVGLGCPWTAFERMCPDGDISKQIKHMYAKRAGRIKVSGSCRSHPVPAIADIGLWDIIVPSWYKCGIGDKIVGIRSPKAAGFPALTFNVVARRGSVFQIDPTLYTIWNQGDFDGDTIAWFKNREIVEMIHNPVRMIATAFTSGNKSFEGLLDKVVNHAVEGTEVLDFIPTLEKAKHIGHLLKAVAIALLSKAATGAFDNFATRAQLAGMDNGKLRVVWNKITQLAITGMKHGGIIPDPSQVGRACNLLKVKLGTITDVMALLSGKLVTFEDLHSKPETQDHSVLGSKIVHGFLTMNTAQIVAKERGYDEKHFTRIACAELKAFWSALSEKKKDILAPIMSDISIYPSYKGSYMRVTPRYMPRFIGFHKKNGETTNEKFQKLLDTANASDNPELCWYAVILASLANPYSRWILTRDKEIPEVVLREVERTIKRIATKACKDAGLNDRILTDEELDEVIG